MRWWLLIEGGTCEDRAENINGDKGGEQMAWRGFVTESKSYMNHPDYGRNGTVLIMSQAAGRCETSASLP